MPKKGDFKLDEIKRSEICAILAVGGSRKTAAHYVGCDQTTIRRTAVRPPEFGKQLARAECAHELRHLRNISKAAKLEKNWRAAAWSLERAYPDRYAQRKPDVVPVAVFVNVLSQLAKIIVEETPEREAQKAILGRLSLLQRRVLATVYKGRATPAPKNLAATKKARNEP